MDGILTLFCTAVAFKCPFTINFPVLSLLFHSIDPFSITKDHFGTLLNHLMSFLGLSLTLLLSINQKVREIRVASFLLSWKSELKSLSLHLLGQEGGRNNIERISKNFFNIMSSSFQSYFWFGKIERLDIKDKLLDKLCPIEKIFARYKSLLLCSLDICQIKINW